MLSKTKFIFLALFGLIGLTYSTRVGGSYNSLLTNVLSLVPPLLAAGYAARAAHTYKTSTPHGRAIFLISAGLLFWFIGEAAFFTFQFIVAINPYPSIADISYMTGYVLIGVGLLMEMQTSGARLRDFNQYIQFLIGLIMGILALAVLYFGVFLAYVPSDPPLNNLAAIGYGAVDLVLILPTLYVMKMAVDYRGGKLFISWALLLIALLLNLLGDLMFAIYRDPYTALEWPYNMIDIVWAASYLLFAYSFVNTSAAVRAVRKKIG